ncbi:MULTISPECIES: hypothetical protein [Parageobacillus]|jgi:hypothetical protein|uniref:Group-specific protein n=1 Tax=Parageobacillus thermoglucosidasius TaxID=1426 RepID=A0A1B7KQT2_PARTM|nr:MULTISPECIES: hypothetical protein [Parageobacillus]OAT72462.1 hypothetical protein A7K69_10085 [Parageobacillus thermoglucosidasius]BDG45707.1 hypothetical protein PspKH34_02680 [Parageobacillus sp. KH3-4]
MLKNLPRSVKIGITRSITRTFEAYMRDIEWNEQRFDPQVFMQRWRNYIVRHSSWFHSLDDRLKTNPLFHQELADKINSVIDKVLSEAPTEEQLAKIRRLAKLHGEKDIHVSCKAEADYQIERLERLGNMDKTENE